MVKEMKISDRVILPLVGSAFQSGKAAEAIEKIEDKELAQIVLVDLNLFMFFPVSTAFTNGAFIFNLLFLYKDFKLQI